MMTTDVKSTTGKFIVGMAETDTIAGEYRDFGRWFQNNVMDSDAVLSFAGWMKTTTTHLEADETRV